MRFNFIVLLALKILLFFYSCHKFNLPEIQSSSEIANTNLKEVLKKFTIGQIYRIQDPFIVKVKIVGNDIENNLYNSIVVEDSSAGITINIDAVGLYNYFPLGSTWIINLQGLCLYDYAQLPQLSLNFDTSRKVGIPIPIILQNKYFYFIDSGTVSPNILSEDQINSDWLNRYIELLNMEFYYKDTNKYLADYVNKISSNLNLSFCTGSKISFRTSGYADFANQKVPKNNGSIKGILSTYNGDFQILPIKWDDLNFSQVRCGLENARIIFNEDFENFSFIPPWIIECINGNTFFTIKEINGNKALAILGNQGLGAIETWIVSPEISLPSNTKSYFSFFSNCSFENGATIQPYITLNFTGSVNTSQWNKLEFVQPTGCIDNVFTYFKPSGLISLNSFSGKKIRLAFKYTGQNFINSSSNKTTNFYLDDWTIINN